jgi:hypothetical protein
MRDLNSQELEHVYGGHGWRPQMRMDFKKDFKKDIKRHDSHSKGKSHSKGNSHSKGHSKDNRCGGY